MLWATVSLVIAVLILIFSLVVSRVRTSSHRPMLISCVMAITLGVVLLVYRVNTAGGDEDQLDTVTRVLFSAQLILTFNAVIELIKWIFMRVSHQRNMRVPRFLLDVVGWLIVLLVSPFIVERVFNQPITGLVVSSTVVSAVVALSLQQLLSSFFAGIALQIESPFLTNDWVEIDGEEGQIMHMNWRTLTLRTRKHETVVIPNGVVASQKLKNFSRPNDLVAIDASIGVSYADPPSAVKRVLRDALIGVNGVSDEREPLILVMEYADSGIVYRVRFWIHDFGRKYRIYDEVMTRFWYALHRNGMVIPFPQRDVHLNVVKEETEEDHDLHEVQMARILAEVPLFTAMSAEQCRAIAAGARVLSFATGEQLIRQNDEGDSLYIIMRGEAKVELLDEHGHIVPLGTRAKGDFIGEMSLLTGAARTATISATSDVEAIEVEADTFRANIADDPDILVRLTEALEQRQSNVESKLAEHAVADTTSADESQHFIGRVQRFLGIIGE